MNESKRRIRIGRNQAKPDETQITTAYVQRIVQEVLASVGLDNFPQWKGEVERQLHTIRVIMHDIRDAVSITSANEGSAKNRVDELLEQMGVALLNLDEIMSEDDTGPTDRQRVAQDLLARFRQHDPRYEDPTGADVETDDFEDPLDGML